MGNKLPKEHDDRVSEHTPRRSTDPNTPRKSEVKSQPVSDTRGRINSENNKREIVSNNTHNTNNSNNTISNVKENKDNNNNNNNDNSNELNNLDNNNKNNNKEKIMNKEDTTPFDGTIQNTNDNSNNNINDNNNNNNNNNNNSNNNNNNDNVGNSTTKITSGYDAFIPKVLSAEMTITDSIPLELAPEDIKITEFLGEGVYSEVYKGYCYGTQTAVKKFKNQGFDPEVLKEVRKEVRIMKSLHHPNLLLFLGACTKPGHLMIVTELMEKSFHEIAHSNLDLVLKLKMAKEAAKGISWLHSLTPAIIHRDLKPENILVGQGGKSVKVADFGLSLVKDHSLQEREEMKRIRGSPAFMSPEALLGSDLSPKTDVYSFGVILWELITGKSPYDDLNIESFDQLIDEICEKGTREKIPDTVPSSVKKLIEMCWQPTPELRPSFIQIIGQLDDCILETAISDKEGRRMWKRHFGTEPGMLKYDVPWEHFLNVVSMQLKMAPGLKIFQGLKSMVIKHDTNLVSLEEFGNVVKWFGPMLIADEPENNFIYRMQNLLTKRWFHGDITLQEAQTRLAGTEAGTFLIRFSSNPGHFALSKMIENQNKDHVIVHIRISHVPGGKYTFVLDGKVYEYNNLEDLVKSPVLGLTKPCQGSKYYAQFRIKQVHSGYVNTVTS